MPHYCAIRSCKNSNLTTYMHSFTRKEPGYQQWLKAVGRPDLYQKPKKTVCSSVYVCDIHFAPSTKIPKTGKSNLKPGSVPTLFLDDPVGVGTSSSAIVDSSEKKIEDTNADLQISIPMESPEDEVLMDSSLDCFEEVVQAQLPSPSKCSIAGADESQNLRTKYRCCHRRRYYSSNGINLLKAFKIMRKKRLSPHAKELQEFIQDIQRTARQLFEENTSNQKHINHAIVAANSLGLIRLRMKESSFDLYIAQIKSQPIKFQNRYFSMEDKVFALPIFKQSPKIYSCLSKIFALPSRKSMQQLMDLIPIGPGINKRILEMLKDACKHMIESEKYCALLFDERPISPGIYFNKSLSSIEGFVYCGEETKLNFADHVMIFMVTGILKKWKQPIAYFLLENEMSVPDLTRNIKTIIKDLQDIGLYVFTTICNQNVNNVKTIKVLVEETTQRLTLEGKGCFFVGDENIFPLFDPPNLLNCVRNDLLKYNAIFEHKERYLTACWSDIVKLYEFDNGEPDTKILPELSDCHIYERKMNKLNVKFAAQVFSKTTSASLNFLAKYGKPIHVTDTMIGTSEFLLLFDKLFDSVNGSSVHCDKKPLNCAISENSKHIEFYSEAIHILRTIRFKKLGREYVPQCILNWIFTLQNLQCIWDKLHSRGIEILCPRNLNLDLLKNFFSKLRKHGIRNKYPTYCSFKALYKALIVGNFLSNQSPYANCDTDGCKGALNFLQKFLNIHVVQHSILSSTNITDMFIFETNYNYLEDNTNAYVAGFLERYILKKIQGCNTCKQELNSESHIRIDSNFYKYINQSFQIITFYLPKICTFSNIVPFLRVRIKTLTAPTNFQCQNHNLARLIYNFLIPLYVVVWIQNVNSILKGKICTKITDEVRNLAIKKYYKLTMQQK